MRLLPVGNERIILFLFSCLLITIVLSLYWHGLYGPFLLDDLQSITPAEMREFSWKRLLEISLQNETGPLGRPLSIATFALNHYFFGSSPFSFKAVNLFLHILVGINVGIFVYLLILLRPKTKRFALLIACLTAAVWLIHPLQVSTVLYPVQRMTQLCHLFILMGLSTYLLGRIRLITRQSYALPFMSFAFVVYFPLALLCKENGALFPFYVFCIEYFMLDFYAPTQKSKTLLKHFHRLFCLIMILAAVSYYWLQLSNYLAIFAEKNLTMLNRLLTEADALRFYLQLILLPRLSQMSLYHDDFPIASGINANVLIAFIILICCGILIFCLKRRAPIVAFGLAWFFVSHLIESTIIPLEVVFEHRNYLAMLGVILIPIYYSVIFFKNSAFSPTSKTISFVLCGFICFLILSMTYIRANAWSSPESFLKEESIFHPLSPRAHIEIANWLLNQKKYDEAFSELDIAANLQPFNAGITLHKLLVYCRYEKAPPALYALTLEKVRQSPVTPYVILVLDKMVQNIFENNCPSLDKKAILNIIQTAEKNPFLQYKPLYSAVLYHLEAGIVLEEHDISKSLQLLFKSFKAYPTRLEPLIQKAYLELQHGMYPEAENTVKLIHVQAEHYRYRSPSGKIAKLDQAMKNHPKFPNAFAE